MQVSKKLPDGFTYYERSSHAHSTDLALRRVSKSVANPRASTVRSLLTNLEDQVVGSSLSLSIHWALLEL
jgi:hypothetical protein